MKTVPGTDGQKMSKSYGNTIPLFASDEEIKTAVMAIPTDSKSVAEPKNPEGDIVFAFHKLLSSNVDEIESRYREGGMGYKESKEMLIENMIRFIAPLREKRKKFETKERLVSEILARGGDIAHTRAAKKMEEVTKKWDSFHKGS
jgi:tryptophanyl-tRNA synthetase